MESHLLWRSETTIHQASDDIAVRQREGIPIDQAIRTATPDKIEAIDMGRRGIHDEGSRTLQERLKGKVRVDFETARRLFTLITVLHWKGEGA